MKRSIVKNSEWHYPSDTYYHRSEVFLCSDFNICCQWIMNIGSINVAGINLGSIFRWYLLSEPWIFTWYDVYEDNTTKVIILIMTQDSSNSSRCLSCPFERFPQNVNICINSLVCIIMNRGSNCLKNMWLVSFFILSHDPWKWNHWVLGIRAILNTPFLH